MMNNTQTANGIEVKRFLQHVVNHIQGCPSRELEAALEAQKIVRKAQGVVADGRGATQKA